MAISKSWRACGLSLAIALLCACASSPRAPECPKPVPANPDLLKPLPEPGYFRKKGEEILKRGRTSGQNSVSSGTRLTNSRPNAEDSSASRPADIF